MNNKNLLGRNHLETTENGLVVQVNTEGPFEAIRPLVDTFKMYLCADTATFCQMYLCTDTIQYQYFSKVSDTDTFSINFWP